MDINWYVHAFLSRIIIIYHHYYYCSELNIQEASAFIGLKNCLSKYTTQEIGHSRGEIFRAVISEHQCQLDIGIDDPEAISIIPEALSEKSRLRARMIGFLHDDKTL